MPLLIKTFLKCLPTSKKSKDDSDIEKLNLVTNRNGNFLSVDSRYLVSSQNITLASSSHFSLSNRSSYASINNNSYLSENNEADTTQQSNIDQIVAEYRQKLERERASIREQLKRDADSKIEQISIQLEKEKEKWMMSREQQFENQRKKIQRDLENTRKERSNLRRENAKIINDYKKQFEEQQKRLEQEKKKIINNQKLKEKEAQLNSRQKLEEVKSTALDQVQAERRRLEAERLALDQERRDLEKRQASIDQKRIDLDSEKEKLAIEKARQEIESERAAIKQQRDDITKQIKKNKQQEKKIASIPGFEVIDDIEDFYINVDKEPVGDGNFALVWKAKDVENGEIRAVKHIDKKKVVGKHLMLQDEVQIMKECKHRNIVKLFSALETRTSFFIVMEFVDGGDLFDLITEEVKFTEDKAAFMMYDLGNALVYLHSSNIVHRDVKPENLLCEKNKNRENSAIKPYNFKLADFGLAVNVEPKKPLMTVCGTPTYVAPEILAETGYGIEVDNWAAGVICYILLCGFPPFRNRQTNEQGERMNSEEQQEELFSQIQEANYSELEKFSSKCDF